MQYGIITAINQLPHPALLGWPVELQNRMTGLAPSARMAAGLLAASHTPCHAIPPGPDTEGGKAEQGEWGDVRGRLPRMLKNDVCQKVLRSTFPVPVHILVF